MQNTIQCNAMQMKFVKNLQDPISGHKNFTHANILHYHYFMSQNTCFCFPNARTMHHSFAL